MQPSRRETRRQIRREAIIDIARISFFENGYAATSMSAIAASVGGSKTTLWSYFPSKEELFAAVLDDEIGRFRADLLSLLTPEGRPIDTLRSFCRAFLQKVLSEGAVRLTRLVMAEAERFPEIGRIFFERAPKQSWQRLADYLEDAMDRGELRRADPMQAARHLLSLCQARHYLPLLWNVTSRPSAEEINGEADMAVEIFLRAYSLSEPSFPNNGPGRRIS